MAVDPKQYCSKTVMKSKENAQNMIRKKSKLTLKKTTNSMAIVKGTFAHKSTED